MPARNVFNAMHERLARIAAIAQQASLPTQAAFATPQRSQRSLATGHAGMVAAMAWTNLGDPSRCDA